jgi:hypothetical protein
MLAVPVQSGTTLVAGRPQVLFDVATLPPFAGSHPSDIAPDGRFYIIRSAQADTGARTPSNMILVLNWFDELKRLVPAK